VLTSQESADAPTRRVYIRLRPMSDEQSEALVKAVQSEFPALVYWENPLCKKRG